MRTLRILSIWRRMSLFLVGLGLWGAGAAPLWAQADGLAPRQPEIARRFVKQRYFNLPLVMPSQLKASLSEIHLYCLDPANGKWTLLTKCSPNQTGFLFDSRGEGEFWFTLIKVDLLGRRVPESPEQTDYKMAVVVDLTPPLVNAQFLSLTKDGYILQVDVRDLHPDPRKTVVEFQTLNKAWRAALPIAPESDRYVIPKEAAITGMVKVSAADLADNAVSKEFDLPELKAAAHELRASLMIDPQQPKYISLPSQKMPSQPADVQAQIQISNNASPEAGPFPTQSPNVAPGSPACGPRSDGFRPCVSVGVEDVSDRVPGPNAAAMPAKDRQGTINLPPPNRIEISSPPAPMTGEGDSILQRINPTSQAEINKDVRTAAAVNGWANAPPIMTTSASNLAPPSPAGAPRRLINQRQVKLDYRLEHVGASGVGKVEIWITSDQGQSWQKLCEDVERRSPVMVELPTEGVFGVTIVVSNGRGFGGAPPNPGDAPDTWVEVDMTRPVVEIKDIRSGGAEDPGTLHITWSARDRNLAADGVDLYYATNRDGHWSAIAKGLRNDYHYRWAPPTSVGSHVYLRVVAHDLAGNMTVMETSHPFAVDDMSRPRGRLIDIVPVAGGSQQEPFDR